MSNTLIDFEKEIRTRLVAKIERDLLENIDILAYRIFDRKEQIQLAEEYISLYRTRQDGFDIDGGPIYDQFVRELFSSVYDKSDKTQEQITQLIEDWANEVIYVRK